MAKSDPIDPGVPAGGEDPKLGNDRIQELARAVIEALNVDHYVGSDGGAGTGYNEDDAGEHAKVTLRVGSAPSNVSNKGFLYLKDVSEKVELFFMDEDGDEIQLSSGGVFNSSLLDGLTITSPVFNTGVSGTAIKDEDDMASDSATHLATQQSIKKYVDDEVAMTPATESGAVGSTGETVFTNGLRIAYGTELVGGGAEDTITLTGWTAVYSAVATINSDNNTDMYAPKVCNISTNNFHIRNTYGSALTIQWFAIGR